MLTNCDYAIECGKKLDCKLVGIGGLFIITVLIIFTINIMIRSVVGPECTQPTWATTHLCILPPPMDTRRFAFGGDDHVDNDNDNGDVIMSVSQVVQLLLRHKADVNFVNEHGNSAMHYACFWGYTGGWSHLYI